MFVQTLASLNNAHKPASSTETGSDEFARSLREIEGSLVMTWWRWLKEIAVETSSDLPPFEQKAHRIDKDEKACDA